MGLLVLSRRIGEQIVVKDNITLTIKAIRGGRVVLAIEAPREVPVVRGELKPFEDRRSA